MSTKEQYWKYSLIIIIIGLGIILFRQITPFLSGLLGALTIYILVRRQMIYLSEKRKMKRSIDHHSRSYFMFSHSFSIGCMAGNNKPAKHQS